MKALAFMPYPGLAGPHCQTVGGWLLGASARPAWRHERLELADGDFVDLAHLPGTSGRRICLFHGLEGCLYSHYVGGLACALNAHGHAVTFMHFRGCSGEPNRLPRAYHSGDTGDIAALLTELRRRDPMQSLAAVGFSLGGNALLKYLGEQGNETPLAAAVAVSVPFDLAACARRIDQGFSRIYQYYLVRHMKASTRLRARRVGALSIDREKMERSRSFRDFDDCVTAPLHGFADADDYYARASSRPWLPRIVVPTLLIQALDDPFVGPGPVPRAADVSASTERAVSAYGGHVGFLARPASGCARPLRWLEWAIPRWLDTPLAGAEPTESAPR